MDGDSQLLLKCWLEWSHRVPCGKQISGDLDTLKELEKVLRERGLIDERGMPVEEPC